LERVKAALVQKATGNSPFGEERHKSRSTSEISELTGRGCKGEAKCLVGEIHGRLFAEKREQLPKIGAGQD